MGLRKILVATDLSDRSDRALLRASQIARSHGAGLTAVSIVDESYPGKIVEGLARKIEAHLEEMAQAADLKPEIRVLVGDVPETLLTLINNSDFDLVVLGRHRHRSLLDNIRQTTMERLVLGALKPVLLVSEVHRDIYQSVVVPVSFSPACAAAIRHARQLAPEATFDLFHAWLVPFGGLTGGEKAVYAGQLQAEVEATADEWFAALQLDVPAPRLVHGSVNEVFVREIHAKKPDLVVIGAHTRCGPALHRMGAFAAELIRDPPTDMLIARAL